MYSVIGHNIYTHTGHIQRNMQTKVSSFKTTGYRHHQDMKAAYIASTEKIKLRDHMHIYIHRHFTTYLDRGGCSHRGS